MHRQGPRFRGIEREGPKPLLGRVLPRKGLLPAWGKLGTLYTPPHEARLFHLLAQRLHDVAMRVCADKLLERGFVFPHGEGPKLSRSIYRTL